MNYNVLVVGTGPAGTSAAFFLKHYDKDDSINVDLIDRLTPEKYEQYHDMCGEAISKFLIDEIVPLKPAGILEKIELIQEHWPGGIQINSEMKGFLIDRTKFLQSIILEFEKIGGRFKLNTLKNFNQTENKVRVKFDDISKDYDYVIAADGANSLVRKNLGVTGHIKTFIQYIVDKTPNQGVLEFFYDEQYEGDYKWIFPHEDKIKIGYPLIGGRDFKPEGKIIKKQSRAIGYGGVDKYTVGRILLVGDAACQTNPISKGGIRAAIIAGKLAAGAIVDNNPKKYESSWLKTQFASNLFLKSFEKLNKMNNLMLEKHIKPFKNVNMKNPYQRWKLYLKLFLLYGEYLDLYKSYKLSNLVGW
jgi:digeranylgeranylglycerophospholipid reductase